MNETWGRAQATLLLERTADWLDERRARGEWHTLIATLVAEVATLGDVASVAGRAATALETAPERAFYAGAITNFDPRSLVRRSIDPRDALEARHPVYDRATVERFVRNGGASSIEACVLDGAIAEARARIASDFDWQLYAATLAFGGDVTGALATIDTVDFPRDRRRTVELVCCVEAYRAGDESLASRVLERVMPRSNAWEWAYLATGFLGRVPWGGYPFDDY